MLLVIFVSTHDAMSAEQALLDHNINIRMIPTPRQFSKSCGLSLLCSDVTWSEVRSILDENHVTQVKAFAVSEENGEKVYRAL